MLYHSIMWQYLPTTSQDEISRTVQAAGMCSTVTAPLACLRFEPTTPDAKPELHLTLWPGEQHYRLAIARPQGMLWSGFRKKRRPPTSGPPCRASPEPATVWIDLLVEAWLLEDIAGFSPSD